MAQALLDLSFTASLPDGTVEALPDVSDLGGFLYGDQTKPAVFDGSHSLSVPSLGVDSCDLDWLSRAVLGDDQAFPLQLDVAEYLSSEVAELVSSPDSNGQLSPGSLSGDWSPSSVSPDWSPSSVSRKAAQQNSPLHFQILPAISRPAALQPLVVDHALCIRPEHDLQESAKSRKKAGTRKERKRVQNRDAATRYRVKKRTAETVLDDRVHCLETENKQLQEKAAQLRHEVTTLKSLWQEMEKLKGGLRNQADDLQF